MYIKRIYTNKADLEKESEKNNNETLISLKRENEQLKKRIKQLEKGLEDMLATANLIL